MPLSNTLDHVTETVISMRPVVPYSLIARLHLLLTDLVEKERGQGLSEYALIIALIAVVAMAALSLFGGKVTSVLSTVARSV